MENLPMRKLKWYYLIAFFLGGFVVIATLYLIMRTTGLLYRLTPNGRKWVDYEE